VLDPGDLAGDDAAALELAAQRHDRVARRDVARGGFRQERLVCHVRLGIDDDHFGLTGIELLRQAQSSVQPHVTCPYDNDPLRFHGFHCSAWSALMRRSVTKDNPVSQVP
jgi:hypothetical protein